ncbi:hypothetical protein RF11_12254 [Thelohanellus kitauei]|uniref:Uncharacterized protein n=1 Tax=Thelohanellus kitauei TaxID=669202 RepID=A0A0C2JST8_THEKT|nr:hypothetical protein RF11_12254 [Thelohanellus kitauei]
MLVKVFSFLAIIYKTLEVHRDRSKTVDLSLGSMKIHLEFELDLKYWLPSGQYDIADSVDIKNVTLIGSKFTIRNHDTEMLSSAELSCNVRNLKDEIKMNGCKVMFLNTPSSPIINYSIGYTIKLNKNTKYSIQKLLVAFSPESGGKSLFEISSLSTSITFDGYTKKCDMIFKENGKILADLKLTELISNLEQYGASIIDENDPKGQLIPLEYPEEDENQINEEKQFTTTRILLLTFTSLLAVVIPVINWIILNRFRKSNDAKRILNKI